MKKIYSILAAAAFCAAVAIPTSAKNWSDGRIMIDPGHGGSDPGASGPSAPHEATLALRCANSLETHFKNLGSPYKLTRTTDTYVALSTRKSASVSYDPYIFCSIHLNAANTTAHGTETWYYHSTGNSKNLANKVQASLIAEMGRTNRGVKQNGWTVITGSANVPAVLTEGLFIDNPTEWGLIQNQNSKGYANWVNGHLYGFYDHYTKTLGWTGLTNPRGGTSTPTTTPTIKVSDSAYSFSCEKDGTDAATFTITGTDLTAAISVSCNSSEFQLSTTSIAKAGGKLTVTYRPSGIGSHSGTITLSSTGATSKTIKVTGQCVAPTLALSKVWLLSDKAGNATSKNWDATKVRNMTYKNGVLYCVYNTQDILAVNAQNGNVIGTLNKAGVSGGTYSMCDAKVCSGKLVVSNLTTSTSSPLKVYVWDDINSNPRLLLETTNFGGAKRIGDVIGWKGNWTSGELLFGNDDGTTARIISYPVTNGVVATTPNVIPVTSDGTKRLECGASMRVMSADGGYIVDGQTNRTTKVDTSGKQIWQMDQDMTWGNAFDRFTWNGTQYAIVSSYDPAAEGTINYTKGRMTLMRIDDQNWSKPIKIKDYPAAGMSDNIQNTNCTSNVIPSVTGDMVETWVLVANQGVGYFVSDKNNLPSYTIPTEIVSASPTLSANKTSLSMAATVGESATAKVTISGANLENKINLTVSGTDADMFTLSKSTISKASASASITVTYTPTSAGNHIALLTASTANAQSIDVVLNGTGSNAVVLDDEVKDMNQDWNFSEAAGTAGQADWVELNTGVAFTRDMEFLNGKLYISKSKSYGDSEVAIVNPETGVRTGTLSTSGVSVGVFTLSGLSSIGGKLIGSNSAAATHALKVYKWDSDTATPTLWFTDETDHGNIPLGCQMNTSGDLNNGRIWFSNANKVVYYTVTNGVVNNTPNIISLSDTPEVSNRGSSDVAVLDDGTFWVTGSQSLPKHYTADGTLIGTLNANLLGGSTAKSRHQGTALAIVNFGARQYMIATTYLGTDDTIKDGAIAVIDLTSQPTAVKAADTTINGALVGIYPDRGLGATRNQQHQTAVTYNLSDDGMKLNVYGSISQEGVAKFSYNGATEPLTGVDDIAIENVDGEAEYYDLQGKKMNNSNLMPGVYIKRNGAVSSKVVIK